MLLLAPLVAHADAARGGSRDASSSRSDTTDVVGGSTVPEGRWPDAVAVIGDNGTCTGTLIAPDLVLTAGHCVELMPSEIVANTADYGHGGTSVPVRSVIAYPQWQGSYDLALLVLASPVPNVTPRALAAACTYDGMPKGTMVHLVGFGLTDDLGTGTNTALHEAMAPIVDPDCSGGEGCRAALAPGGEFVAGGGGTDSCFGDSGGPVYLDTPRGQVLVGAVSRGISGSATPCGDGGIYVRMDKVRAWIEQVAGAPIAVDGCDAGGGVVDRGNGGAAAQVSGGCAAGGSGEAGGAALLVTIGTLAALARRRRPRACPALAA